MKKILTVAAILAVSATAAHAEVTKLKARFGGGCVSGATGSCTIKVTATGDLTAGDAVRLYAGSSADSLAKVSNRSHDISGGTAKFRVANSTGSCYQVRTAPNGNSTPDVKSRTICEK